MHKFLKSWLIKGAAAVILFASYSLAKMPETSKEERGSLAAEFRFEQKPLYTWPQDNAKGVRNVHPSYRHISAWISSVGAAVTLTDLDGDGLSNDVLHVDPRFDKLIVSCADGARYPPFELMPRTSAYDTATMAPMGTLAYDFNRDGQMDVLTYFWGRTPLIFYQSNGKFYEQELCPSMERWFSNAATLSDFDGDGYVDILITNYFPDGSRILDALATDNDQVMQHSMSRAYNGGGNHFFLYSGQRNNQPQFTEHKEWMKDVDHPNDWTLAAAAADIDGDLLPELYLANDFGPDKLLYNVSTPGKLHFIQLKGERHLTDIRSSVLGKDSFKGMGVSFGDINGDGLLDIYVSNIAAEFALMESHFAFINTGDFEGMKKGIAPFRNESEKLGLSRSSWGWDSKLADFNNDGAVEAMQAVGFIKGDKDKWPELQELAIGNDELLKYPSAWPEFTPGADLSGHSHNPFFTRTKSGRFINIASNIGLGQPNVCRGIAIGDMDHDGDLDFITANQWEPSYLFQNHYPGQNNFIGIRLMMGDGTEGQVLVDDTTQNRKLRFAIGATATLTAADGSTRLETVDGGNGHSGKNSSELFFGIDRNAGSQEKFNMQLRWRKTNGEVATKTVEITKGWHTIILPS